MHQNIVRSERVIHQLKAICDGADDGLLRRAALYGLPILLERVSIWVHATVEQVTNSTVAKPSRAAAHEMDSDVAKILQSFTPYEIAVEDGLGYQAPQHSHETFLAASGSPSGGAAVVCEEAWRRFLQTRDNARRSRLDARNEESRDHARASADRFCTHKLLTPNF